MAFQAPPQQTTHLRYTRHHSIGGVSKESGRVASTSQPITLAHQNDLVWQRDSVLQAPIQVRGMMKAFFQVEIEPVHLAEMKKGSYSPCFIVPKKGSGLRPIPDL